MKPEPARMQWSTPAGLVAVCWGLTAGAALWWLTTGNAPDRLFVSVLMLALAAVSCYASFVRPRLRADTESVTVRSLSGTWTWPWHDVRVRVETTRRLGRAVEALEIDIPARDGSTGLIVLTKLDLGDDVTDVARQLDRLRP